MPVISASRMAWRCGVGYEDQWWLETASVTARKPVDVRHRFGTVWDKVWSLTGSGGVVAFTEGSHIWILRGRRGVHLRRVKGLRFLAADGRKIAALRGDGTCWVLLSNGSVARRLRLAGGAGSDFLFRGNTMVVLKARRLQIYDSRTGRLRQTWPVGTSGYAEVLGDVRGRFVTYISGIAVHVLEIKTGRDVVLELPNEIGPAYARLLPTGLAYGYNEGYAMQPAVVGFVPQAELEALFR